MTITIHRNLASAALEAASVYPVVTITGPRQSGKTTLSRALFPDLPYVSLEPADVRTLAREDPRGFLAAHVDGAILDEVQHAPELASYLQVLVDEDPRAGRFVLTGSQHFALSAQVSQSLAGRTAVLTLLPCSRDEVERFDDSSDDLMTAMWAGGYPRIHDVGIPADRWYADYVTTYVQRDVRQLVNVTDLEQFTTFVRLCAGRTAQLLNLSALGADCGVTHNTARAWLGVLEASFLVFRLPPLLANPRKRLTRRPKIHFFDTGLACHLLGIRTAEQLRHHPLRGALFESWVASEIYKARVHQGQQPALSFARDRRGDELDLIVERAAETVLVEVKSAATIASDFFRALDRGEQLVARPGAISRRLVYGGDARHLRRDVEVIPWRAVPAAGWCD